MTRIGLLSDTHGYLDDAILKHLDSCDEIWHVGDFGNTAILETLKASKPFRGVWGNIDGAEVRHLVPEIASFKIEDLNVWMTHIGGYPGRYSAGIKAQLEAAGAGLFISGHSHILKIMFDEKLRCLHMNPGAAGKQGWHKVRTMLRFNIDGAAIKDCEVIEMKPR